MPEKKTPKQPTEKDLMRDQEYHSRAHVALEIMRMHHAPNAKPVNTDMLRIAHDVLKQYLG